jgi:nitrogenase molybdenum-iron protein beta chain
VSRYKEEGYPIINVETGGFKGNNYFGHNLLLRELIEQYLGDATPSVRENLVNVFSVVPYQNANWRGDLEAIKKLLNSIGLEVNILFGHESRGVSEWKDIPNAEFNLVLSPWVGLEAAELLEKKYGTPYLHIPVLPVGAEETSRFLREVGRFAGLDQKLVEKVIAQEEERFYKYFVDTADFFTEIKNGLPYELYTIADSTYALGVSKFLIHELGYTPKRAFLIDNVPERYKGFITEEFEKLDPEYAAHVHYEEDGGRIEAVIRGDRNRPQKTLILGSQWENDLAREIEAAITYLSIPILENLILNKSYLGYAGGLRLIEDIYTNIIGNKYFTSRFRDQVFL